MGEDRPDALLKSALEKIVYFEARSEQLKSDLSQARAEIERQQAELAQAAQREIELRRQTAALEVRLARADSEREQLVRANDALRRERATLVGKLLDASRIHASDQPASEALDFDFAGFISELRNMALAGAPAPALLSQAVPEPPRAKVVVLAQAQPQEAVGEDASPVARQAERMLSEGRLRVSDGDLEELSAPPPFRATPLREPQPVARSEETLFGFSVRELSAPDASARIRAAERLRAMRNVASGPPLASALQNEQEPSVKVALLTAFAEVASAEAAPVLAPLLEAREPEVRVAALKTLMQLDPGQAGPHLSAAMKDPDRAVRRRASLLALGLKGDAALALGGQAICDEDSEVRGLAALVLGASGGEQARDMLLGALRDPDRKVRSAAAQSLSRLLGQDVSTVVSLDDAQRRREVRRLAALPLRQVSPLAAAPASIHVAAMVPPPRMSAPPRTASLTPRAPLEVPESLCTSLISEIRAALRGKTTPDLVSVSGTTAVAVEKACELLVARGLVVRRGLKYFAA